MEGLERPGQGPAGDGVHHGRLDLDVAAGVEEAPDMGHDGAAQAEDAGDVRIHDQVEVALAEAELDVLQAVPLLRQGPEALGQEGDGVAEDGQFARPGLEERPGDRDDVAEVEQAEALVGLGPDLVLADVGLQALAAVGDVEEGGPAHLADGQDAAGDDDGDLALLELGRRQAGERRDDPGGVVGPGGRVGEERDAGLAEAAVLVPSGHDLVELGGSVFVAHASLPSPPSRRAWRPGPGRRRRGRR